MARAAGPFNVEVYGGKELQDFLSEVSKGVGRRIVKKAMEAGVFFVHQQAKMRAPRGPDPRRRPGMHLQDSIKILDYDTIGKAKRKYAGYWVVGGTREELGIGEFLIHRTAWKRLSEEAYYYPAALEFGRRAVGTGSKHKDKSRRAASNKGLLARPFMRPALYNNIPYIKGVIGAIIKRELTAFKERKEKRLAGLAARKALLSEVN